MTKARSNAVAEAAKGDLSVGSGTNLAGILAVGSNGETLVADSSASTGLRWQGSTAAGKNRIINGAMDFWQRGTSAAANATSAYQTADRWFNTLNANTVAWAQETTIVPTGFQYSYKATAGTGGSQPWFLQPIESINCQDLAGKTVTLSAYCATSDSSSVDFIIAWSANYNEPNSGSWTNLTGQVVTTTTTMPSSPQNKQFSIPSTAKSLRVTIRTTNNLPAGGTFCLTGVQLELGNVPTSFSRAGGTLAGELAACQRYYWRNVGTANNWFGTGTGYTSTEALIFMTMPVTMRTNPTVFDYSLVSLTDGSTAHSFSSISINQSSPDSVVLYSVGSTGITTFRPMFLRATSNAAAYVGFGAEL